MSQNAQTHFKNLAAYAGTGPFWDIMHQMVENQWILSID